MKYRSFKYLFIYRAVSLILSAVLLMSLALPFASFAEAEEKTVRVGWHEAPYFMTDSFGRHSGYSYDYLQKVSAYTGWNYEYVEGSWSELMDKLKSGEIDLMANVSFTQERATQMLFTSLPMGTESYHIFVSPNESKITADDFNSLNGKTVGVAKGTIQVQLLSEWINEHGINVNVIELSTPEEESIKKVGKEIDAFVTMDVHTDPSIAVPVWKIGSSDYYFALSSKRSDLLSDLNSALSMIQDENKYYSLELNEKYLRNYSTNLYLSTEEKNWLEGHGAIRVGYQNNYLAFCEKDKTTGELIGALKDYLDYASQNMENGAVRFETTAFATVADAIEALKNGEIDCVFPANLSPSDGEKLGLVMTPALMKTEMDAVVRESDQKEFVRKKDVTVTVNRGNTNYEIFLTENYPGWQIKYYPDTPTGLEAIADGEADCVLISNYRFNNISKQCEKLHLTTVYTGIDMEYYIAVRKGDTELYSILAKTTAIVPDSVIHAALTYYSTEDVKTGFWDLIKDNIVAILLGIIAVVLVIIVLFLRSIRAEKKAIKEEQMIKDLNKQVYVDALTRVRNRGGFDNYMQTLQERIDNGEISQIALGMFDCNGLKMINDKYGHDKGNIYLKSSCRLICKVFQHSPVFRIGGDEFAAILMGEDYLVRDELEKRMYAAEEELKKSASDPWEIVSIASGITVYDASLDKSIRDTLKRADQLMYENKRRIKGEDAME